MIHKMREIAPIIMLVILVSFVGGTIFLNWGMNVSGRGKKMIPAGKINGKEISIAQFDKMVRMERQRMQEEGKEIPPQQYRMVPQQVWEQEVNRRLMTEVIKEMQLDASAEEVFSYIRNNPLPGIDTVSIFQTDGKFDTTKYEQFLNDPRNYEQYGWLHEIEAYTASSIVPMQKLETLLGVTAQPSRAEVGFAYYLKNSKVVFEYIKAPSTKFPADTGGVTDALIAQYYEANKDSFKVDDQADLYYVAFEKKSTPTDEKIYYDELLDMKKRIEASDMSLPEAFTEEASLESDDPGSAQKGGDLGWFGRGRMVKEFDSVAFSLPVGTISDPVKSSFGLHLIFVENREEKDGEEKVKARHILRKIEPTIETLDLLSEKADSLRSQMLEKGFMVAAKDAGMSVDSTGLFEKGKSIPGIGYLSGAGNFAFGKMDTDISERLENEKAVYLLKVKRMVDAGVLPLDDAKKKIRKTLLDSSKVAAAQAYLVALREKLDDSTGMAAYKDIDSTVVSGITDTVSGDQYVAEIGFKSPVVADAFILETGKVSDLIEWNKNVYLIKPVWKKIVDSIPEMTDPEMQVILSQMTANSSQKIYYAWYVDYKNHADIKNNIKDFYLD